MYVLKYRAIRLRILHPILNTVPIRLSEPRLLYEVAVMECEQSISCISKFTFDFVCRGRSHLHYHLFLMLKNLES